MVFRRDPWTGSKEILLWLGTRVSLLGVWAAAAALLVIVLLNALNIVLRYFFFAALSWAEEAMLYLMIFGVYAAGISIAWQHAHIRIDAVLNAAPARWRRTLDVVSTLLLTAILAPVVVASHRVVNLLYEFEQRSDALHLPMWIPQGIIPASLAMIIVMSVVRLLVPASEGRDTPAPMAQDRS